ncbi:hypothetical protein [Nocardia sp. CA-135398]
MMIVDWGLAPVAVAVAALGALGGRRGGADESVERRSDVVVE